MQQFNMANLIVFRSPNGRDGWIAVKPDQVPVWLKTDENIAQMMAGNMCCDCGEGDKGSDWFAAMTADEFRRVAGVHEAGHA